MELGMKVAVLVTTLHRGVFFGFAEEEKLSGRSIELADCRNCIFWDSSIGGFLGLASVGPNAKCKIGTQAESVLLHDVTSVSRVSEQAVQAWKAA
jgi:hypothetical protein